MNTQFKKGVMELCVLDVISRDDVYGYAIVSKISKYISVNENTIYPILHRLLKEHYLDSYLKESSDGPARKYYKLTESGQKRSEELKSEWFTFAKQVEKLLEDRGENNEE